MGTSQVKSPVQESMWTQLHRVVSQVVDPSGTYHPKIAFDTILVSNAIFRLPLNCPGGCLGSRAGWTATKWIVAVLPVLTGVNSYASEHNPPCQQHSYWQREPRRSAYLFSEIPPPLFLGHVTLSVTATIAATSMQMCVDRWVQTV